MKVHSQGEARGEGVTSPKKSVPPTLEEIHMCLNTFHISGLPEKCFLLPGTSLWAINGLITVIILSRYCTLRMTYPLTLQVLQI